MREIARDMQYDVAFDSQRFSALMVYRGAEGFDQKLEAEKAYVEQQLKTDIGERLDVAESTYIYEIKDGKLYEPGRDEPFEDVIRRGIGRNLVDLPREKAELASFSGIIQGVLANPDTPDGRTILDVSTKGIPGSNYQKNYFDVHTKVDGQVISTRYLSNLTNATYRKKILELNPDYAHLLPENPTDIDFKLAPLIIPSHLDYSNPDDLARFLLGEKIGMSKEELEQIWINTAPLWTSLINTLVENPQALGLIETQYVAFQKGAIKTKESDLTLSFDGISQEGIIYLAKEKVIISGGGCGSSEGLDDNKWESKFSFGAKESGKCKVCRLPSADKHYHCPRPNCHAKFADETSKPAEKRTKACNCGFKFGCNKSVN